MLHQAMTMALSPPWSSSDSSLMAEVGTAGRHSYGRSVMGRGEGEGGAGRQVSNGKGEGEGMSWYSRKVL